MHSENVKKYILKCIVRRQECRVTEYGNGCGVCVGVVVGGCDEMGGYPSLKPQYFN